MGLHCLVRGLRVDMQTREWQKAKQSPPRATREEAAQNRMTRALVAAFEHGPGATRARRHQQARPRDAGKHVPLKPAFVGAPLRQAYKLCTPEREKHLDCAQHLAQCCVSMCSSNRAHSDAAEQR